jgi:CheY-like chemotaxis protein
MTRILIIDDEETVRRATQILLDAAGFETVAVADGPAGVKAVRESVEPHGARPFDLAIVDLFMPGMDGLATTKALRDVRPSLPVLAVSGFMMRGGERPEMPNFEPMAAEAGAVATLYKPFRPKELIAAVRQAIGVAA